MKKYITIAALLAAGSAFANAGELDSALYSANGTITGISNISGSFSYTLAFDVEAMRDLFSDKTVRPTFVCADMSANNVYLELAAALNDTGFVGMHAGNTTLEDLPLGGGDGEKRKPMTAEGSTPATNNFADANASGNLMEKMDSLSGIAVTFSHTDKVSSSLYVTLKFSDATQVELYGKSNDLKWSTGVGELQTLYVKNDYIDSVYLFAGDVDQVSAFARNAAAIPEPSAFGLLAGLGALALVGTRRRRK